MYNVNEIVSRMNQGESLDNIAAELTAALNEAKITYEAEQALKAQAQTKAAMTADMEEIMDLIIEFLRTYYPDLVKAATEDLSRDDKVELYVTVRDAIIDSLDKTAKAATNPTSFLGMNPLMMAMMMDNKPMVSKPVIKAVKTDKNSKSEDEVLKEFLNKICH